MCSHMVTINNPQSCLFVPQVKIQHITSSSPKNVDVSFQPLLPKKWPKLQPQWMGKSYPPFPIPSMFHRFHREAMRFRPGFPMGSPMGFPMGFPMRTALWFRALAPLHRKARSRNFSQGRRGRSCCSVPRSSCKGLLPEALADLAWRLPLEPPNSMKDEGLLKMRFGGLKSMENHQTSSIYYGLLSKKKKMAQPWMIQIMSMDVSPLWNWQAQASGTYKAGLPRGDSTPPKWTVDCEKLDGVIPKKKDSWMSNNERLFFGLVKILR